VQEILQKRCLQTLAWLLYPRLSTKPDISHSERHNMSSTFPLSNYCFIPTRFFDAIVTKQTEKM